MRRNIEGGAPWTPSAIDSRESGHPEIARGRMEERGGLSYADLGPLPCVECFGDCHQKSLRRQSHPQRSSSFPSPPARVNAAPASCAL